MTIIMLRTEITRAKTQRSSGSKTTVETFMNMKVKSKKRSWDFNLALKMIIV